MPAEKTGLIALSYIGTQCTMYMLADKFNVSESSVHTAVYRVVGFLTSISRRAI